MPNVFIAGSSVGGCNDGPGVMTLQEEVHLSNVVVSVRIVIASLLHVDWRVHDPGEIGTTIEGRESVEVGEHL